MNPVKGTEILFLKNGKWYNKNYIGDIVPTDTYKYFKRYQKLNSLVVINDEKYNDIISNINNGELTVVVDKNEIGLPELLSFENTKEWMSLNHFLKLRKQTDFFCHMAKKFYIPNKKDA